MVYEEMVKTLNVNDGVAFRRSWEGDVVMAARDKLLRPGFEKTEQTLFLTDADKAADDWVVVP